MAQEIAVAMSLAFSKAGAKISAELAQRYFDVSGNAGVKQVQTIGTTDEVLDLGEVGTIGLVLLKNLDPTNFITVGSDGTLYPLKLKPNEAQCFRWNAAAIHAKANTAACDLEYTIIED